MIMPGTTIEKLLSYNNENFIRYAYAILLCREPDIKGLQIYLSCLQKGMSKIEVLVNIRISKEGKTKAVKIVGLKKEIFRYKLIRVPIIGKVIRFFWSESNNRSIYKRLSIIEGEVDFIKELFLSKKTSYLADEYTNYTLKNLPESAATVFVKLKKK